MSMVRGVAVGGLLLLVVTTAGVAAANDAPLAEAGLDQEAELNTTVYLDAGGSLDPDGEIVGYEWSIERPDGSVTAPACADCPLTEYVPMQTGQHNVTVTVTDDDGASASDTLLLQVSFGGAGPGGDTPGGFAGGFGSMQLDGVHQDSDGNMYLTRTEGDGSEGFVMQTANGEVQMSTAEWNDMAGEDGTVTWNQAKEEFHRLGYNQNDVRSELEETSGGGFASTYQMVSNTGSGAPDSSSLTDLSEQRATDDIVGFDGSISVHTASVSIGSSVGSNGALSPGIV